MSGLRCACSDDSISNGGNTLTARGSKTRQIWWALWTFWLLVVLQQIALEARFGAPVQLLVLQVLPLLVFIPWVLRDSLHSLIWLSFVLLGYFVIAVQVAFARPEDGVALAGVFLQVILFLLAALYIRFRGRELRLQQTPEVVEKQ
jgi:uncharacterized membrane protein